MVNTDRHQIHIGVKKHKDYVAFTILHDYAHKFPIGAFVDSSMKGITFTSINQKMSSKPTAYPIHDGDTFKIPYHVCKVRKRGPKMYVTTGLFHEEEGWKLKMLRSILGINLKDLQ